MHHNPKDPDWPDRDRFVLSAGHGSALLYSVLHLSGYDLPLDELKRFRQWGSLTPGHPERDRVHVTPGVEVTTGPLGQGFANGVGMAFAEKFLRQRYGAEVQDHFIYAIVSDGDLMEGIAAEAASLAGQYGLGKLVYLYDDNSISLDGPTSLSFDSEDVGKRFEAYGWHVLEVHDANDVVALQAAIEEGQKHTSKPSLIRVKSIIGYPSPNKQGTSKAHGSPLGEDEVRATKEAMGWDPDAHFLVPDEVYADFAQAAERGAALQAEGDQRLAKFKQEKPDLGTEWDLAWAGGSYGGRPLPGLKEALRSLDWSGKDKIATRSAGQNAMAAMAPFVPTLVGGAADLSESTKTEFPGDGERFTREHAGRNIFFGVREHGMGGAVNGLAAHGGIVRPYGSTFLQFADYMRGAIRLSALTGLRVAWVYTHDSVGLGEDGPTHQPVEHLAALRAIPGLDVVRPADATETAVCWRTILEQPDRPAGLALTRQKVPTMPGDAAGAARGAYVVADPERDVPQVILIGTGSEVQLCVAAYEQLAAEGTAARVVSMPSWELFEQQDAVYRDAVLPPNITARVAVEQASTMGWDHYVGTTGGKIGMHTFGSSAPLKDLLTKFGFTASAVLAAAKDQIKHNKEKTV
jgi:transketolase